MDLHLQDKIVIVTGGGAGIGAAISQVLAEEGAVPIILGRSPLTPEFEAQMRALQPRFEFHALDLRDEPALRRVVDDVISRHGVLHGLVNNAGVNDHVALEAGPLAFMESLERNLIHVFTLTHLCAPHLRKTSGSIVTIGSKTSLTGQGDTSGYIASKGALLGLTREWAVALRDAGVRVNAVVVAECWTPLYEREMAKTANPAATRAAIEKRIPLGQRMTTTRELADTVVFTLSDRASHTTGQWLVVDGGYTHLDRAIGHDL
jgi:L-fucose dehydrogenase